MRHTGRVIAVQVLYGLDAQQEISRVDQAIAAHYASFERGEATGEDAPSQDPGGEARSFAAELCHGVASHLKELDQIIERASEHWRVARMSRVDRNVLRVAVFELRFLQETPAAVVLDEAIELGKQLGSTESGVFINGVLGQVISGAEGRGR